MRLFQFDPCPTSGPEEGRVETPLGALVTWATVGSAGAGPGRCHQTWRLARGGRVLVWDGDDCRLELLRCSVQPSWWSAEEEELEGWALEGCEAAVWRFLARADGVELAFRCAWEALPAAARGGSSSGQFLAAQTWDFGPGNRRLSLGTEDEEYLGQRAASGDGMPARLAPLLESRPVRYSPDGLQVSLPPLAAGEGGQLRFLVAWNTPRDEEDASTWYAVDVPRIPLLLEQAGCR